MCLICSFLLIQFVRFSCLIAFPFSISGTFDVVVVNLYPFYDKVTSSGGVEFEDGIENIDIGGPAMIRAAAKVVCLTENANFFILSLRSLAWKIFCWPNTIKLLQWKRKGGHLFIAYCL